MDWLAMAKALGPTVAQIGSAVYQANRAGAAADQMGQATAAGLDEQRRQFDLTRGDLAPYREAGTRALPQYEALTNAPTTAADAMADPGYAWAQQQGQQAIDRKFAASGGRMSGAALKAASRFNAGNASQFFGAADQRRENRLSRLAALAGIGQSATNTSAAAGQNSANAITGLLNNQGEANAGSTMARGSIWADTGNSLAAQYGRGNGQWRFDPVTGRPIGG
jgi:hypothetical protein